MASTTRGDRDGRQMARDIVIGRPSAKGSGSITTSYKDDESGKPALVKIEAENASFDYYPAEEDLISGENS